MMNKRETTIASLTGSPCSSTSRPCTVAPRSSSTFSSIGSSPADGSRRSMAWA